MTEQTAKENGIAEKAADMFHSCTNCKKYFDNANQLAEHVKIMHGNFKIPAKPRFSRRDFRILLGADLGYLPVSSIKAESVPKYGSFITYKCKSCSSTFSVNGITENDVTCIRCSSEECVLASEKEAVLAGQRQCPECLKMLSVRSYALHVKVVHAEKRHNCDLCSKTFKCLRYLRRHLKNIHHSLPERSAPNVANKPSEQNAQISPELMVRCWKCHMFVSSKCFHVHDKNCLGLKRPVVVDLTVDSE